MNALRRRAAPGVLALCALAAATTAVAGAFSLSPIRLEFSGAGRTQVLTVHNDEDRPVVVQLRTLAWSQEQGADQLTDTHELLATPPLFTVPAKGEQIVRVALRRAADPVRELDYRLVLEEVPPAAPKDFLGLQVALRVSLPVFVQPVARAKPSLAWSAVRNADGRLVLRARNDGTAHVQVLDFDLRATGGDDALTLHNAVARYLLPGSATEWPIDAPAGSGPVTHLQLRGASDQGDIAADLEVASP